MPHYCATLKSINIRSLKNGTSGVLERVALGETLEVRRRNKPLAVLMPIAPSGLAGKRPDYRKRLRDAYGDAILRTTATELISSERGDK